MRTTVRIYATELTSSQTCNLGISNADTGAYYATDINLSPYEVPFAPVLIVPLAGEPLLSMVPIVSLI